jgi:hypothetical protein
MGWVSSTYGAHKSVSSFLNHNFNTDMRTAAKQSLKTYGNDFYKQRLGKLISNYKWISIQGDYSNNYVLSILKTE